jgi:hypothetical protein
MKKLAIALIVLMGLGVGSVAFADPLLLPGTPIPDMVFNIDLLEFCSWTGLPSNDPPLVGLGAFAVQEGWLVLYYQGIKTDVVHFYNDTGRAYAKLWADEMCPTLPTGAYVFEAPDDNYPVVYHAGLATYQIFTNPDHYQVPTPIPPAVILFGSGLLGLVGWRRILGRG